MAKLMRMVLIGLLAVSTVGGASAKTAKPNPQLVNVYRALIALTQDADARMTEQIDAAGQMFTAMARESGHIPESSPELSNSISEINHLLPDNPYKAAEPEQTPEPDILISSSAFSNPPPKQAEPRVEVIVCHSLTESTVQAWENAPPSDWQADPGSIKLITDNSRLIVGWGAGSNRRPLIDQATGKTRLFLQKLGSQ